jgi:2,3-bisphosphoglycerate-independent phosphoglycerate mutase
MDMLAKKGKTGRLVTVPDGFHPGSEVANSSIMGYDQNEVYEGRGPLESSCLALLGKHIHIGFIGVLQESLSTQSFYRVVSHSVAKNDNMFHLFF